MKELTINGELFKDIAEMLIATYSFGTRKMVRRYDLYDWSTLDFNHSEVVAAYHFLVENEWIREYTPTYTVKSRMAHNYGSLTYVATKNGTYIGLTEKGWAVAKKYIG